MWRNVQAGEPLSGAKDLPFEIRDAKLSFAPVATELAKIVQHTKQTNYADGGVIYVQRANVRHCQTEFGGLQIPHFRWLEIVRPSTTQPTGKQPTPKARKTPRRSPGSAN